MRLNLESSLDVLGVACGPAILAQRAEGDLSFVDRPDERFPRVGTRSQTESNLPLEGPELRKMSPDQRVHVTGCSRGWSDEVDVGKGGTKSSIERAAFA